MAEGTWLFSLNKVEKIGRLEGEGRIDPPKQRLLAAFRTRYPQ